jgi:hypothetical protein
MARSLAGRSTRVVDDVQINKLYNISLDGELQEHKVDNIIVLNRSMTVIWAPTEGLVRRWNLIPPPGIRYHQSF